MAPVGRVANLLGIDSFFPLPMHKPQCPQVESCDEKCKSGKMKKGWYYSAEWIMIYHSAFSNREKFAFKTHYITYMINSYFVFVVIIGLDRRIPSFTWKNTLQNLFSCRTSSRIVEFHFRGQSECKAPSRQVQRARQSPLCGWGGVSRLHLHFRLISPLSSAIHIYIGRALSRLSFNFLPSGGLVSSRGATRARRSLAHTACAPIYIQYTEREQVYLRRTSSLLRSFSAALLRSCLELARTALEACSPNERTFSFTL